MNNFDTCYYKIQTDAEILSLLLQKLQEQGITTLEQLDLAVKALGVADFSQMYALLDKKQSNQYTGLIMDLVSRLRQQWLQKREVFASSAEVGLYLADKMLGQKQEQLWGLYLNSQNRIVREQLLFQGTVNRMEIHSRDVFRPALLSETTGIIIAHNHPSGDLLPSAPDKRTTSRLQEAAAIMQVALLDHFIVGSGNYFSFRENNLI